MRVVLKDGTSFVAKFRERTQGKVLKFDDHPPVKAGDVRAFSILWRGVKGERQS